MNAYGYRVSEHFSGDLPALKDGVELNSYCDKGPDERGLVATSLGCHLVGASLPRPDYQDPASMLGGAAKRFLRKPPNPVRHKIRGLRRFVRRWIRKNLRPLSRDVDVSVDTWLDSTNYSVARKVELREVAYGLLSNPLNHKDAKVDSFMKDESYTAYKYPRAINSRSDRFKVFCGPIFKQIEKIVFEHHAFIKHVDVAERPAYIKNLLESTNANYLVTDYTAFESLFVRELQLACEMQLYEYMSANLTGGEEWYRVIRRVLLGTNHCHFKNMHVSVPATRMSGEMCTSLGNGFSNLMLMLFACEQSGADVEGVVEGDDGLFAVYGPTPDTEYFASLGLLIKLERHETLDTTSFCGLMFDPEDLCNVADPRKVVANFGWSTRRYARAKSRILRALLRAKSFSILAQYPGCPILQSLGKYGLRVTQGVRNYDMVRVFNRMSVYERERGFRSWRDVAQKPIGLNTRFLVEELYGLSVESQYRIESYFDELNVIKPFVLPELVDVCPDSWQDYWSKYVAYEEHDTVLQDPRTARHVEDKLLSLFQ